MSQFDLNIDGDKGLKKSFLRNNAFQHSTGKSIKFFPFRTKGAEKCELDFRSFEGIVGECARKTISQEFNKGFIGDKQSSFNNKLKDYIIENALTKVNTDEKDELKEIMIKLFFKENNELVKFNNSVIKYKNNSNSHPALEDISQLFNDIFIDVDSFKSLLEQEGNQVNLFYQLIKDCLPKLENIPAKETNTFFNSNPDITNLFKQDLMFLSGHSEAFLTHIEDLFKYYYFFYISQSVIQLDKLKIDRSIDPIYFALDWENLSQSRVSYRAGWRTLESKLKRVFTHSICLELLNHITFNGNKLGDFAQIHDLTNELSEPEIENLLAKINDVNTFYLESNSEYLSGDNKIELDQKINNAISNCSRLDESFVRLMTSIEYILEKSNRTVAGNRYADWIIEFTKVNYLKRRGRSGYTTNLTQETLLFLVKLIIGDESRIRLKDLWDGFELRGIKLDESSKTDVVKLIEKINLLEKKSDSGDAQYVKSFI